LAADTRDRFLKLERPREAQPGRVDPLANETRFEHLGGDREAAARPPAPARAAADRFRLPRERGLEVANLPEGAQPFTRCARCQADNTRYAPACTSCGAALDTPEQRAFNERLWAARGAGEAPAEPPPGPTGAEAGADLPAGDAADPSLASRLLAAWPEGGWRAVALAVGLGFPLLLLAFGQGRVRAAGGALLLLSLGALPSLRDRFTRS